MSNQTSNANALSPDSREYEVGFGKPPVEYQFKAGQSGNPRGRRKASGNILQAIRLDLDEQIRITQGKASKKVSSAEALIRLQIKRALSGDYKAFMWVIKLSDRTNKIKVPTEADEQSGVLMMPWELQKSEAEQGRGYSKGSCST